MISRTEVPPDLWSLAALQGNVVTRQQATRHGFGPSCQRRQVRQGYWTVLASGILLTRSEPDWLALAWAGVLRGGDHARLGGMAAGHLAGLVDNPPERILVLHPHAIKRSDEPPWAFQRERDGVRRSRSVGNPPRTGIDDTVLDLCLTHPEETGQSALHWITEAVQRRLTTAERLRRALADRPRFTGRRELRVLLGDTAGGAQSVLEHRYLNQVERAHELPLGRRQSRVRGGTTVRDVHYDRFGTVVELDGELGHSGTSRFRDFRRDNASLMGGEGTLRYGMEDVSHQPCGVALQVAELLIRGGWTGYPARCPDCPGGQLLPR